MDVEVRALLAALVRAPSPSGEEGPAAELLASWAAGLGCPNLEAARDDAAVRIRVRGRAAGPTLLFASHLDTVPPGAGWSRDPIGAAVEHGMLFGRGAADAKGSVAAMAAAAAAVARAGGPARGELVLLASFGEETRHPTLPLALERLERPPAACVVGEPTGLRPCTAQRGLLALDLHWRGEQFHAGWAGERGAGPANAIVAAARDLARLESFPLDRIHKLLGRTTLVPTTIRAGVARNTTPPECVCSLDVRTTPAYSHAELAARLRAFLAAEVELVSDRRIPMETPQDSALLAALRRVDPALDPVGSPTSSDWVWLGALDALKLGPGDSRLSHGPDERIALEEVERAAALLARLAREYLA